MLRVICICNSVCTCVAAAQGGAATVATGHCRGKFELRFGRQPRRQAAKLCVPLLHASACHLHPARSYGTYSFYTILFLLLLYSKVPRCDRSVCRLLFWRILTLHWNNSTPQSRRVDSNSQSVDRSSSYADDAISK